jgi:hypothetical protein
MSQISLTSVCYSHYTMEYRLKKDFLSLPFLPARYYAMYPFPLAAPPAQAAPTPESESSVQILVFTVTLPLSRVGTKLQRQ